MQTTEIPLSADNQQFSIKLADATYTLRIIWRDDAGWILDLQDSGGSDIIAGMPLVTGVDLLAQHAYLGLGFSLLCLCDIDTQEYPTKADLGTASHLYVVTE